MSSRRIAKVAEALRETISTTVLFGIRDPRVKNVTVLRTEVSPDLKAARVYVTVMGDDTAQSLAMHGLRSARGYIQSQIAEKLELRYTPILSFVLDQGVKRSIEAAAIIRQALGDSAVTSTDDIAETADAAEAGAVDATGDETTDIEGEVDDGGTSANHGEADGAHAASDCLPESLIVAQSGSGSLGVPGSGREQTTESMGN